MATRLSEVLRKRGKHNIGNLNTAWAKHVVNGARLVCKDDDKIDNFILVEISDYNENGELTCKPLSDKKNQGFLLTTVEEDQLMDGESYVDFFNANGEMVRLTRLETGVRFETSAIKGNSGVKEIKRGMVAHFDVTDQNYIISDLKSPHADYADALDKFIVVDVDTDFGYSFDKQTIRLERQ